MAAAPIINYEAINW